MRKISGLLVKHPRCLPLWNSQAATYTVLLPPDLSAREINGASSFSHERTVRRMLPKICYSLTARPTSLLVRVDLNKTGARSEPSSSTRPTSTGRAMTKVDVVLPSEWARLDIVTCEFWKGMRRGDDYAPLVENRRRFYGNAVCISALSTTQWRMLDPTNRMPQRNSDTCYEPVLETW